MTFVVAARKPMKGIKDVFYETRVLLGREYTLRRFVDEVLGKSVDPVMLGYIEKGKRFPSEALVRRLAVIRKEDAHELLAILWRDRMIHAFGRELKKVLQTPRAPTGVDDADLAVLLSQGIAALPDDGTWVAADGWRKTLKASPRRRPRAKVPETLVKQVEKVLKERDLIETRSGKVRKKARHFIAEGQAEKQALALEFCALFAKSMLDKLALVDKDTHTYLRDHYFHIDEARLPEFQERLDQAVRELAEEFAGDADNPFLNVLISSTTI
ncbi:MAG: hypothetical protein P8R42_09810 [Candidatus Binatia bacterium]|nr:hypothetical protein [Candidatus Binatia bacterium]